MSGNSKCDRKNADLHFYLYRADATDCIQMSAYLNCFFFFFQLDDELDGLHTDNITSFHAGQSKSVAPNVAIQLIASERTRNSFFFWLYKFGVKNFLMTDAMTYTTTSVIQLCGVSQNYRLNFCGFMSVRESHSSLSMTCSGSRSIKCFWGEKIRRKNSPAPRTKYYIKSCGRSKCVAILTTV